MAGRTAFFHGAGGVQRDGRPYPYRGKGSGQAEYRLTEKQEKERSGSRSLFVVKEIKAGEKLTPDNVRSIRPHHGLHTMYYEEILGKTAACDIAPGTPLAWEMIR